MLILNQKMTLNTILAKISKTVALKHFKAYHQAHFQKNQENRCRKKFQKADFRPKNTTFTPF